MRQSPWLAAARGPMLIAMLPAAVCILATVALSAWAIFYSFTNVELTGARSINWSFIGFDNYVRLFTREGFLNSLWVTFVFTFFSAIVGQSVVGFTLAVTLRGTRSLLRNIVEVAVMLGWLLPDIVAAFMWNATTSKTGLINSFILNPLGVGPVDLISNYALTVVVVANIWKGTAWSYLLFSAALDSISREILEAARVDGATPFQRIRLVILPMLRSHIATNLLLITIWTFGYFALIFALTGGGPGRQTEVLSILMFHTSFNVGKLGFGSAIAIAMMLLVGVLAVFYLRQLKEPK
ncbi:MAG: sugar ABC transporter permease [Devosia nanyangense]|uniref:Sugar ABC transporter permease n=1 Tax=Devosia nanyangense TaxID=1228055 RepID=A0A933L3M7_9HYPH|nr:sugar ABC transporter permease [Devosia nanyangense]